MRRFANVIVCLPVLACLLACGGVPPTYYYRVDYSLNDGNGSAGTEFSSSLGIMQFDADILYEGDRIVYRDSPYEVQFYHYRRWIAPPRKLVTEKVFDHYKSSNLFANVVRIPSSTDIDYVLTGSIESFEEWDESDAWYGLVTIEFSLRDAITKEIVWEKTFSEKTMSRKKETVEVVKAISESLNKVIANSVGGIRERLASNN